MRGKSSTFLAPINQLSTALMTGQERWARDGPRRTSESMILIELQDPVASIEKHDPTSNISRNKRSGPKHKADDSMPHKNIQPFIFSLSIVC